MECRMSYQPHSEMTLPGRYTTRVEEEEQVNQKPSQIKSDVEMTQVITKGFDNDGFNHAQNSDVAVDLTDIDNGGQRAQKSASKDDLLTNDTSVTLLDAEETCFQKNCLACQNAISTLYKQHKLLINRVVLAAVFIAYNIHWGFAIHLSWNEACTWCDGVKFLTIINICIYSGLLYFFVLKPLSGRVFTRKVKVSFNRILTKLCSNRYSDIIMFFGVMGAILAFVLIDSRGNGERLISYVGIVALLAFGFIFSKHPHKIVLRHVSWGILLQFLFALCILRWNVGKSIFDCIGNKITTFLSYTDFGSSFTFGYLVTGDLNSGNGTIKTLTSGNETIASNVTAIDMQLPKQAAVFAFKVLPVVAFFSFCTSILYYYGIMQWVVIKVGWVLQVTVGTTAAESMNASANIFMGQTEAPLLIRPYLPLMTKSELHAVMTGGFATIAGAVMAAYIGLGISASHLLSASVMSAPAALAYAKLFYPETEVSKTTIDSIKVEKGKEYNALEAAINGLTVAVSLMAIIATNLIAFIAFIYFIDGTVGWFGSLVGWPNLRLTYIMAKVFTPLAYLMGVKWEECEMVGELLGLKTIVNEFVAYDRLRDIKHNLSERSVTISTYALCGFSNLASIGIQLGGLGTMAPNRLQDLAQVAFRAFIAGSAACFMTACIAGAMMTEADYAPS